MKKLSVIFLLLICDVRCEFLTITHNMALTKDYNKYWMMVRSSDKEENICAHVFLGNNNKELISCLNVLDLAVDLNEPDTILGQFYPRNDTLFVVKKDRTSEANGIFFITADDINEAKKAIIAKEEYTVSFKPVITFKKPDKFGYIVLLAEVPGFVNTITVPIKASCDLTPGEKLNEPDIIKIRHEIIEHERTDDIDFFLKLTNIYEN